MELSLTRIYKEGGTIGTLCFKQRLICFTIELPWLENRRNISCIPEGIYEIKPRFSPKFGNHLAVTDVYGRNNILIHPANNAATELNGCIAPVRQLSGIGEGLYSRVALDKLLALVHGAIEDGEKIKLNINSNRYEYLRKVQKTNTKVL